MAWICQTPAFQAMYSRHRKPPSTSGSLPATTLKSTSTAGGVWTSLTAPSGVTARNIQNPPVYLTWADPTELANALQHPDPISFMATSRKSLVLQTPRQSIHGGGQNLMAKEARTADKCGAGGLKDTCVLVTVNFSPSSAKFVYDNKLLLEDTFKAYLQEGYTEVPAFPVDAVNIKPVYKIISPEKLVDGRYYTMPAWPGTPNPAKAFPEPAWGACIYIDTQNQSQGDGSVDKTCASRSAGNTYNLNDFIHIPITTKDMARVGELASGQFTGNPLEVGDTLILVGMHTNTREILRWTWQTFWCVPDSDSPLSPSSKAIAHARPAQLQGAARHYAMASAFQMLVPAQPVNGGKDVGSLLAAYNPHLEAEFGTNVFDMTRPVQTPAGPVTTDLGAGGSNPPGRTIFPIKINNLCSVSNGSGAR
jgi:hypothetical protein